MTALHLISGLIMGGVGLVMILQRGRLTDRERPYRNIGPTGWAVLGTLFVLSGLVQLLQAAL